MAENTTEISAEKNNTQKSEPIEAQIPPGDAEKKLLTHVSDHPEEGAGSLLTKLANGEFSNKQDTPESTAKKNITTEEESVKTQSGTDNETNAEQQRFTIPFVDTRKQPFPEQTKDLQARLTEDKVDIALLQTKQLLGAYARQDPKDLGIKIIPGEQMGNGQVTDRLIELEMPEPDNLEEMRLKAHPVFGILDKEQLNNLVMAINSSTILHEGVHCLLNSRPDAQFAHDFEKVSGIPNQNGQIATLLDEGIAYAIQGINAPNVEPVGSLAPQINPADSFMVRTRKELGEKLRPILAEYTNEGKSLDTAFMTQAGDLLKLFDYQRYIDEVTDKEKQISSAKT